MAGGLRLSRRSFRWRYGMDAVDPFRRIPPLVPNGAVGSEPQATFTGATRGG